VDLLEIAGVSSVAKENNLRILPHRGRIFSNIEASMKKREFQRIRHHLDKTQKQMSELLGLSLKAVQSFEQGWRNIPVHVERQCLFLLAAQGARGAGKKPVCWTATECPAERRENCPAWEFQSGHLCWMINGTICHGTRQKSWRNKMKLCRQCDFFQSMVQIP
jgi:DNA-binding transcriptional regulator YiaG